jgi:hypothetical protein
VHHAELRERQYFSSAQAREEKYSVCPGGDLLQTMKLLAELRDRQHRYDESAALKKNALPRCSRRTGGPTAPFGRGSDNLCTCISEPQLAAQL